MFACLFFVLCLASFYDCRAREFKITRVEDETLLRPQYNDKGLKSEECSTCIQAAVLEINILLNEILNGIFTSLHVFDLI
jgi:hypothetical protein